MQLMYMLSQVMGGGKGGWSWGGDDWGSFGGKTGKAGKSWGKGAKSAPPAVKLTVGGKAATKAAKGAGKVGGASLARTTISKALSYGTVADWKGKFGWIEPSEPISHPAAGKHGGKIYVNVQDLEGAGELCPGGMVQFIIFSDASGLGAAKVTPL